MNKGASDLTGRLRGRWHFVHPLATSAELEDLERAIGATLPEDYKAFLQFFSNGGEALVGPYLHLIPAGELSADNAAYQVAALMPRLFLFAHDDSDGFAFDLRPPVPTACPILTFALGEQDPDEVEAVGHGFSRFLEARLERGRRHDGRYGPRLAVRWEAVEPLDGFAALDAIEAELGLTLPANYKAFLQFASNGGKSKDGHLELFPAERLLAENVFLRAIRPHLFLIGRSGARGFAFDLQRQRRGATYPVVSLPLEAHSNGPVEDAGADFIDFLDRELLSSG